MNESINLTPIKDLIEALLDTSKPFSPTYLYVFSDIPPEYLREVKLIWNNIQAERRYLLLKDLEELMEADTLINCDDLGHFALGDSDPRIRSQAIRLLWECDDPKLGRRFCKVLQTENDEEVQTAAASALGKFVQLGELEEITKEIHDEVVELLLDTVQTHQFEKVRRKALESLGYSSHEQVSGLIQQAIIEQDTKWVASALFAMGRSADTKWERQIIENIQNQDNEIKIEAIHAAGELELKAALPPLLQVLQKNIDEDDIRHTAIWALSKIGGEDVEEALQDLLESTEDEEEVETLKTALENLAFSNDIQFFDIL
ncbi:MAG TPA: HEAT repeat domain-containing protein [Anaerolineae bacterium]|nr:HEAT repeat domain-containing protein [Anaerolineae bacterium]